MPADGPFGSIWSEGRGGRLSAFAFHDCHHGAAANLRQPLRKGIASEVLAQRDPAAAVQLAHRKRQFRQVNTDGYSAHGDFPRDYADGENHHGHQRPSGGPQGREVSFLLIQADTASRRGLTQVLGAIRPQEISSMRSLLALITLTFCGGCSPGAIDDTPDPTVPAAARPQPSRSIVGLTIGQLADLPECEKEKSYGQVYYKTFSANVPCWARTVEERDHLSLRPADEMLSDGTLQAELGRENVPEGVLDSAGIKVISGKIEQIELKTFGSSRQDEILALLTQKWGDPSISKMQELQNGFGAQFHGVEAQWLFSDFTVAFFGVMTEPDEGIIIVRSAVAAANENEQKPKRATSF